MGIDGYEERKDKSTPAPTGEPMAPMGDLWVNNLPENALRWESEKTLDGGGTNLRPDTIPPEAENLLPGKSERDML